MQPSNFGWWLWRLSKNAMNFVEVFLYFLAWYKAPLGDAIQQARAACMDPYTTILSSSDITAMRVDFKFLTCQAVVWDRDFWTISQYPPLHMVVVQYASSSLTLQLFFVFQQAKNTRVFHQKETCSQNLHQENHVLHGGKSASTKTSNKNKTSTNMCIGNGRACRDELQLGFVVTNFEEIHSTFPLPWLKDEDAFSIKPGGIWHLGCRKTFPSWTLRWTSLGGAFFLPDHEWMKKKHEHKSSKLGGNHISPNFPG